MKYTLSSHIYYLYTLLCAVLRERWGKGVSAECAWLLLQEFNPSHGIGQQYTGKELEFIITYLLFGDEIGRNFGIQEGFVVMGIKQKEY